MKQRCAWVSQDPLYIAYHDSEWGVPVYEDERHFEFLILEGAQAGLSWLTVLKRRTGYRRVFADFNVQRVAAFSESDIASALIDEGIIRNSLKVRSAVQNARVFMEIQAEFGSFNAYIWGFVGHKPVQNKWSAIGEVPSRSLLSDTVSEDLKHRGMSFVGSTIMYAHLQATGLINDHTTDCFRYAELSLNA